MCMDAESAPVICIYDFRGKQEFIYGTNRMREITGASELLADLYGSFLHESDLGGSIRNDWREEKPKSVLDDKGHPIFSVDEIGIVVYEGGGNLCVLFKTRDWCVKATREFSRMVLKRAHSLPLVMGCADWIASSDPAEVFQQNRTRAYRSLDINKRVRQSSSPCNVLPFTQVDSVTFQPIVEKGVVGVDKYEHSAESVLKLRAYKRRADNPADGETPGEWERQGKSIDEIGTAKDDDSLIAVVYFDGNSIGNRLMEKVHSIDDMRAFSVEVHQTLVVETERRMREALSDVRLSEEQKSYRVIVDHGDEITLICNAHAAPLAIDAYFDALQGTGYHACAGMAICHPHAPYREVYRIAEECCESGKAQNRKRISEGKPESDFIDFHYCRSGITGTLTQVRKAQEESITARPYEVRGSYQSLVDMGVRLGKSAVSRSDLKELNRSILRGDSWYELELERLRAKDISALNDAERIAEETDEDLERVLFDLTSFIDVYDVRFAMAEE